MNPATKFLSLRRAAGALFALGLMLGTATGQTIVVDGTVKASNLDTLAAPLTVHPSFPWTDVDNGSGSGTSISGFSWVADSAGLADASRLTYSFTSLTLTTYSGGGPGDSLEIYTPDVGSTFSFSYDGAVIATGTVTSLTVNTNFVTGAATGSSIIQLTAPGADTSFYDEIGVLSGGTHQMVFDITSFDAVDASGNFTSAGIFSVSAVPEPSTYAAFFGLAALGLVSRRRTRRA